MLSDEEIDADGEAHPSGSGWGPHNQQRAVVFIKWLLGAFGVEVAPLFHKHQLL